MTECMEQSDDINSGLRNVTLTCDGGSTASLVSNSSHSESVGNQPTAAGDGQNCTSQISTAKQDEIAEMIGNLSPSSQDKLQIVLQKLSKHEVIFGEDDSGRPALQYNEKKKLYWDTSNANIIATPKSDKDLKNKMDACLELIDYLKHHKAPSGIALNQHKAKPNKGQYREGIEFEKTKDILGRGNSAGDIVVIKDKSTGSENAQKTIMISVFRPEEIQAWVDLSETGICPEIYLFKLNGNKIDIQMEKLENVMTLTDVIDKHMGTLRKSNPALIKPFSLYIFHDVLSAVQTMHKKGWSHRDLHSGNVMLQRESDCRLKVRVLDFGTAVRIEDKGGLHGFRSDVKEAIRKYSALYLGEEFESQFDLEKNWKEKVEDMSCLLGLSKEDKEELFCLMESALQIVAPHEIEQLKKQIGKMAELSVNMKKEDIMKEVITILYPGAGLQRRESTMDSVDAISAGPSFEDFLQRIRRSISIGGT